MLIDAPQEEKPHVVLIPMGAAAEKAATGLLADLRRAGIASDMGFRGNMKKRMQRANASGAQFAVIIGDDELADRKSVVEGKRVSVRVALGGRRCIKKKKKK